MPKKPSKPKNKSAIFPDEASEDARKVLDIGGTYGAASTGPRLKASIKRLTDTFADSPYGKPNKG